MFECDQRHRVFVNFVSSIKDKNILTPVEEKIKLSNEINKEMISNTPWFNRKLKSNATIIEIKIKQTLNTDSDTSKIEDEALITNTLKIKILRKQTSDGADVYFTYGAISRCIEDERGFSATIHYHAIQIAENLNRFSYKI